MIGNNVANANTYGGSNANTNSASADTYANCNNDTKSYSDTNGYAGIDTYRYTHTGYGLSTVPDSRSHQGSQHTVQFHGTGQPH